jgi:hypothetical protein
MPDCKSRKSDHTPSAVVVEPLEPRVLYSADFVSPGIDLSGEIDLAENDGSPLTVDGEVLGEWTLVYIDAGVPDRDLLINDLRLRADTPLKIVEGDAGVSGLDQIFSMLSVSGPVEAVHIISHGTADGVALGDIWINSDSIDDHLRDLAQWQPYLTSNADILIYGCELASSTEGRAILEQIALATNADVAASDDLTGYRDYNGDWQLEFATGIIEAEPVFTAPVLEDWRNTLAVDLLAVDDDFGDVLANTDIPINNPAVPETNVLENDQSSAPSLRLLNTTGTEHGTVVSDGADQFTYQPASDFTGADSFDYIVTDSEDPILHHYPLDSNIIFDETARSTPNDSPANRQPTFNPATGLYDFDGNDYIELPDIDYGQSFTISFEFFVDTAPFGFQNLFQHGTSRDSNIINVSIERTIVTTLSFYLSDSDGGSAPRLSIYTVPLGWHKLDITHAPGGGFEVYLDGTNLNIYDNESQRGGDFIDPEGEIQIGRWRNPGDGEFRDYLSDHKLKNLRIYNEVVTPLTSANDIDYSTGSVDLNLRAPNRAPVFSSLDATPTYVEDGPPILIDADVRVTDPDFSAVDSYGGSVLSLYRNNGADPEDTFHGMGNLNALLEGSDLILDDPVADSIVVGTILQNSGGTLSLQFNDNASESLVNQTLQAIGYSNSSDSPPDSVELRWTFSDEYSGDPAFGTAKSDSGTVSVGIESRPDIAISTTSSALTVAEDSSFVFTGFLSLAHDQDASDQMAVELSVNSGVLSLMAIPGVAIAGNSSGTLQLNGTAADINAALSQLTYLPSSNFNGSDQLSISVTMGAGMFTESETVPIAVIPVNDQPLFGSFGTVETYEMAGAPVVVDPDITLSDVELEASGNYDGTTLSLTRTDATDYAPTPQFETNRTDAFSSSTQPDNLAMGSSILDGTVAFGTVTSNSDGLLEVLFNASATKSHIESLMRSIAFENTSAWPPTPAEWPHDSVVLEWKFRDGGIRDDGSRDPGEEKESFGYSAIDIITSEPQPIQVVNADAVIELNATDQTVGRESLIYIDLDTGDGSVIYELTSVPGSIILKRFGTPLTAGDSFSQEDINFGGITISSNTSTPTVDTIEFNVSSNSGIKTDSLTVRVLEDLPSNLLPGVQMNMDGGNDSFLGDTSQYRFVDGNSEITWEFIFSGLTPNAGDLESTLYSAADSSTHYEHLVISPIADTDDGLLEWDIRSFNPGGPTIQAVIPDVFDGDLHSVALTLKLGANDRVQLFYDGVLMNSVPTGLSATSAVGGFPWVIGQQLLPGSDFSTTGGFENYQFAKGRHFSGTMHDVRIWDVERTEGEINESRFARFSNSPESPPGLTVNWPMHEPNNGPAVEQISDSSANPGEPQLQPQLRAGNATGPGFTPSTLRDELGVDDTAPNGLTIGYVFPEDPMPDAGGYEFELLPVGQQSAFAIDPKTGRISVANQSLLSETVANYDLQIRVSSTSDTGASVTEIINLTIDTVNEPPALNFGANTDVTFVEGEAPVLINPAIVVSDDELEATTFAGARLLLQRYDDINGVVDPQPQDRFSSTLFDGSAAVTVLRDTGVLELEFNAGASAEDVNNLLQSIRYENLSEDPLPRIKLQWDFSDENNGAQGYGGSLSDSGETTVNITPVNDDPALAVLAEPFDSVDEDTTIEFGFDQLFPLSSDVDGSVTHFKISNVYSGAVSLVDSTGGTLSGDLIATDESVRWTPSADTNGVIGAFDVQAVDNLGGTSVARSVVVNVDAVSDTPLGTDSTADLLEDSSVVLTRADFGFSDVDDDSFNAVRFIEISNGILQRIPPASATPTDLSVPVVVSVADIDAGLISFKPSNNVFGETAQIDFQVIDDGLNSVDPVANTLSINLLGVNDPPTGGASTHSVPEDGEKWFVPGDFAFSDAIDVSSLSPVGDAPYRVIVETVPSYGRLIHNDIEMLPGDSVLFSEIASLLKYVPDPNSNTSDYFEFRLRDNGGTDNQGIDISVASYRIDLNIAPVNDPPAGTDGIIEVREGASHKFDRTDFGFVDTVEGDELATVYLLSLPADGSVVHDGTALSGVGPHAITAADLDGGLLTYQPPASTEGNVSTDLVFRVRDNGGDDGDSVDTDPGSNTLTIINQGVNLPPVVDDGLSITLTEDTRYTFNSDDFSFTDSEGHALLSVTFDTLPFAGELRYRGSALTGPVSIPKSEIDSGELEYIPAVNSAGAFADSFSIRVQDAGGDLNSGVDQSVESKLVRVDINSVNDSPVLSGLGNESLQYVENASGTLLAETLLISDVDNMQISSATVTISKNYYAAEDRLLFVAQSGIDGVFDTISGQLELSGPAPVAAYQSVLQSVAYLNVSENPTEAPRNVSLQVSDGESVSNLLYREIIVVPVNDPPSAAPFNIEVREGDTYRFSVLDFGFIDTMDNHELRGVRIDSLPDQGALIANGVELAIDAVVERSVIDNGEFYYVPPVHTEGNQTTAFKFTVQDTGQTVNGGADLALTPSTATIENRGVNDAPVPSGDQTITVVEDTAYVLSVTDFPFVDKENHPLHSVIINELPASGAITLNGVAISAGAAVTRAEIDASLLAYVPAPNAHGVSIDHFSVNVRDAGGVLNLGADVSVDALKITVDGKAVNDAPTAVSAVVTMIEDIPFVFGHEQFQITDTENHSLQSIVVEDLPLRGSLQLDGSSVSAGAVVSAADIGNGLLVYRPAIDDAGEDRDRFSFLVRDDGGSLNGDSNESVAAAQIRFDIVAVNDAPTGSDLVVSMAEDTAMVLDSSWFGLSDREGDALGAIEIATLPQRGTLLLGGSVIDIGTVVSVTALEAEQLTFVPFTNEFGTSYASFAFYVRDDAVAPAQAALANVLRFDVVPVDDAPTTSDSMIDMVEDQLHIFSVSNFSFSDSLDGVAANRFESVLIEQTPVQGTLSLDGVPLQNGDVVSAAQIAAGQLTFQPVADASGSPYAEIVFRVSDDGVSDHFSSAATLRLNVSAQNDRPVATDDTLTVNEGGQAVASVLDNDFDVDDTALLTVTLADPPAHGRVSLHDDGTFHYTHDGSESRADQFTYTLSDGQSADAAVVNVLVLPVNDVPVATEVAAINTTVDQLTEIKLPADLFTDTDTEDTLTIGREAAGEVPDAAWLVFDLQSMTLTGRASEAGVYVVRLTATDGAGERAIADIVVNVADAFEPPVASALAAATAPPGVPVSARTPEPVTSGISSATSFAGVANEAEADLRQTSERSAAVRPLSVEVEFTEVMPPELVVDDIFQHRAAAEVFTPDELGVIQVEQVPPLEQLFGWSNLEWQQSQQLAKQLDESRDGLNRDKAFAVQLAGSMAGMSAGLSLGYIVWLLRGGVLISSVLTSLPAWRTIDPLPVLDGMSDDSESGRDESLQDLVSESQPHRPRQVDDGEVKGESPRK